MSDVLYSFYVFLFNLSRHSEHTVRNRHQHRTGDGGLAGPETTQGKSVGINIFLFYSNFTVK